MVRRITRFSPITVWAPSLVALLLEAGCHPQVRPEPAQVQAPPVKGTVVASTTSAIPESQPTKTEKGEPPLAIFEADVPPAQGTQVTCPVCGDEFKVEERLPIRHYRGRVFIFCCERCLPHFDKDPETFLKQKQ